MVINSGDISAIKTDIDNINKKKLKPHQEINSGLRHINVSYYYFIYNVFVRFNWV